MMFFAYETQTIVPHKLMLFVVGAAIGAILSTSALAQGSVGGSIGKRDKSVSGDERAPPPRQAAPKARAAASSGPKIARVGRSLSGLWNWTGQCAKYEKPYTGTFTIVQSGNQFDATHGGTNMWDSGTITNGYVSGNRVSFDRTFSQYTDHLSLAVSGSGGSLRMVGVLPNTAHSGRCVMTFVKS